MDKINDFRRNLLRNTLGLAISQCIPGLSAAQPNSNIRVEWQQFKNTAQCQSFINAIRLMRDNTDPNDRGSLQYWANVHQHYCPHGIAYFLSWHRGYLYFFEQQLRITSGDPTLNLPYWNYYLDPVVPGEFTDPSPSNPLYLQRSGTNVYNALSLWPFSSQVFNFQRGTVNAFESRIESIPHNPVHDLIGGIMSTMMSPLDPLFYLHHANIDRLTHAWALPDGKGIPDTAYPYSSTNSDPYWSGSNSYDATLGIERFKTYNPTWLGYDYDNNVPPRSLPPQPAAAAGSRMTTLRSPKPFVKQRPPFLLSFDKPSRKISARKRSLGSSSTVSFNERSVSAKLLLRKRDAAEITSIVESWRNVKNANGAQNIGSVTLVIVSASLNAQAARGGYFYEIYLNMPSSIDSESMHEKSFVGTIGAFQINSTSHHGNGEIKLDLVPVLLNQETNNYSELSFSWIRIDGESPPNGETFKASELRVEVSYEKILPQVGRLPSKPGRYNCGPMACAN